MSPQVLTFNFVLSKFNHKVLQGLFILTLLCLMGHVHVFNFFPFTILNIENEEKINKMLQKNVNKIQLDKIYI